MQVQRKKRHPAILTLDKLVYEARLAGVGFFEVWEWTWGELCEYVNIVRERERRQHQHESVIAFRQAELIASWIWKKKETNVVDVFPYWTDEDKNEVKLDKYKAIMYKYASNKVEK